MRSGMDRMCLGLSLALIACVGLARAQAPVRQASGGVAREAMYLRLFQEIDKFEAEADALEATGVQPTELRSYHQRWLRLSPDRADLLKQAALECMRDLRSSGMLAEHGVGRSARPTLDAVKRGMARVAASVDSLAAVLGPSEFARLNGFVRRYVSSPGPRAVPGRDAFLTDAVSTASDRVLGRSGGTLATAPGCSFCPTPDGENGDQGGDGAVLGGLLGGWFVPALYSNEIENYYFDGRAVWEEYDPNSETDECNALYPGADIDPITAPTDEGGVWVIQYGMYDSPDFVVDGAAWVEGYMLWIEEHAPQGYCGEHAPQKIFIDSCGAPGPYANYATNAPTGVYVTAYQFIAYRSWNSWVMDHPR